MCYTTLHTLHYTTLHYTTYCLPAAYTIRPMFSASATLSRTHPHRSTPLLLLPPPSPLPLVLHTAAALRPRRDCIDCPAYIELMVPDVFIGSSFYAITKHPAVDIKSNSLEPGTSPSSTWAADRTLERSRPSRIALKTRAGAFPLLGRNHTPWLG